MAPVIIFLLSAIAARKRKIRRGIRVGPYTPPLQGFLNFSALRCGPLPLAKALGEELKTFEARKAPRRDLHEDHLVGLIAVLVISAGGVQANERWCRSHCVSNSML